MSSSQLFMSPVVNAEPEELCGSPSMRTLLRFEGTIYLSFLDQMKQ